MLTLFKKILTIYYWIEFFKELRYWYIINKATKENESFLNENNLRVDWVGRIYTVVNLPEEIAKSERDIEPYVIMQIRMFDAILMKLGVREQLFPEIRKISDTAYLVIIQGPRETLYLRAFIWNIIKTTIFTFLLIKLIIWMDHSGILIKILNFFSL